MKQLECVLLKRVRCLAENVQTPEHHVHICNIWINYQHPRHGISLSRCLGYLFYYFDFFFPPSYMHDFIFLPSPLAKLPQKLFQLQLKSWCYSVSTPEWIWTSVSSISTLFFFLFRPQLRMSQWCSWLVFGPGSTGNWNLCTKGASAPSSEWVRLHSSRADDTCCGGGVGVWERVGNWRVHLACGCVWRRISYWSSAWWMSNRRPDARHTPHISFTVHFFNVKGEPRRLNSSGSLQLL